MKVVCLNCRKLKESKYFSDSSYRCIACSSKPVNKYTREKHILRTYGLSSDDWYGMYKKQGGVCLICGKHKDINDLHVDHDHVTGTIRGLLCIPCNTGLGLFKDNIALLKKAILYIKNSS